MAKENWEYYFLKWKLCEIQFSESLKLEQGLASSFGYCLRLQTWLTTKDHIQKA